MLGTPTPRDRDMLYADVRQMHTQMEQLKQTGSQLEQFMADLRRSTTDISANTSAGILTIHSLAHLVLAPPHTIHTSTFPVILYFPSISCARMLSEKYCYILECKFNSYLTINAFVFLSFSLSVYRGLQHLLQSVAKHNVPSNSPINIYVY